MLFIMADFDINSILKEFGLSNLESTLYLTCLELGAQPASVLAKKSGLKRSHSYNILSTLIEKSIMQEYTKGSVRYFNSRPPKSIISILEHRKEEIEIQKQKLLSILPDLEKIRNPLLAQPKIHFFQGLEGMKEIYEDTLKTPNTNIYGIGDFQYFFPVSNPKEFNEWLWEYTIRRAKKKIKYFGILNKSQSSDIAYKHRKAQNRVLKMLNDVHIPVEINVYGNKVAIVSIYRDIVGIIIEEPHIAESLRNIHKSFWQFLPDYK